MNSVAVSLRRALEHAARGDIPAARVEAERALAADPASGAANHVLGVLCCRAGQLEPGIAYFRRALELDPADAASRLNLVRALVDAKEFQAAEAISAGERPPGRLGDELLRLHAFVLQELGRAAEAAACYDEIVSASPRDWQAWNNLGNARRSAGDTAGAVRALQEAVRLHPELAAIRFNLGLSLAADGRVEEAAGALESVVEEEPGNHAAWIELGRALDLAGHADPAIEAFATASRLAPLDPLPYHHTGTVLLRLGRYEAAEAAFRRAIDVQPDFAPGYLQLGTLLEHANRLAELGDMFEEADTAGVPQHDLAYLRALWLQRNGRIEEALACAEVVPEEIGAARKAQLIGKLSDRLGRTDSAFTSFAQMNRVEGAAYPDAHHTAADYRRRIEALTALVTANFGSGWATTFHRPMRPAPAFLVGFPRSGTTLLDTLLMGHPALHVLEEEDVMQRVSDELGDYERLPTLKAAEVERLRQIYFEQLDALAPPKEGQMVVDKLPLNIVATPLIHRIFPDAKFIFAQRHPCDVVLSCFMQSFKMNDAMASFLNVGDAAQLYDRVLTYWTRCREVFPLSVRTVRYEALVDDPKAEMRSLVEFLEIPWDERLLDHRRTALARGHIKTPSYAQVSEQIYDRAIGRWMRYRDHLREVFPILKPWVERLGYPPLESE